MTQRTQAMPPEHGTTPAQHIGPWPGLPAARQPVVTVCIVNRQCRDHLRACLDSLLRQPQGVTLEVIVVDNASTDDSAAMAAREFPEARLIRLPRPRGFAWANNQAAQLARGEFLFFLNNDTVVPPGTLAELVEFQGNHPEAWLIGPALIGADGMEQRARRHFPTVAAFLHRTWLCRWTGVFRAAYRDYCRNEQSGGELLMGSALFVRRDRFTRLGQWDEDFVFGGEDMELCWRARRRGGVVHAPFISVVHHGRASTRRHIGEAHANIAAGFVKFFRKTGAPPPQLFFYKLAVTLDAPLQLLVKAGQVAWRLLRGQWRKAAKCGNDLKGIASFLFLGLGKFWRA